jgi:Biotin-lipoyl like/HlyD family secretion protein
MTVAMSAADAAQRLGHLADKARQAETERSLWFQAANDAHEWAPYRSALVFQKGPWGWRLVTASGLDVVDRRSAYGSWCESVLTAGAKQLGERTDWRAEDFDTELAEGWREYWPEVVHVYPMEGRDREVLGAVVFLAAADWTAATDASLRVLHQIYGLAWQGLLRQRSWAGALRRWVTGRGRWVSLALLLAIGIGLSLPVQQFVIAPAETVSLDSVAVTSPLDGIVSELVAKPNQAVKKGDVLFRLDDTALRNRLAAARQTLAVTRAEYLAGAHRAFTSSERGAESSVLRGRIQERLSEVRFLEEQLGLMQIRASRDGIAVYGQENDWIGRPVSAGQRVMELADARKVGVDIWVPVTDALSLEGGQKVQFLLYASPLDPLTLTVTQASYLATRSPDGVSAYRVRATLDDSATMRLGLRGNAKLSGAEVSVAYFLFRRPLMVVRQWLGA